MHEMPEPGYMPDYYINPIRETLKNSLGDQFQSSATPDLTKITSHTPITDKKQRKIQSQIKRNNVDRAKM